jgi:hypothetical protein
MRFFSFFKPRGDAAASRGAVKVGWFFDEDKASVILPEPERMRSPDMSKAHAKSASRCPAVINVESRYFVVRCPYDMHLRFARDDKGRPHLRNMLGDMSPIRQKHLGEIVTLTAENEWRYPARPTLQIALPYIFVADEPVYISQVPPFFHLLDEPWPGTLFCGRFPIHVWPRPLMWAFEWHDTAKDLILKRGDPWFYVHLETTPQDRGVALVEAERTPELISYVRSISGVVKSTNQTFSLFGTAAKRRPKTLLKPLKR